MENPLAADGPAADIELQEVGPFPLTLNDMFTNSYVVEARHKIVTRPSDYFVAVTLRENRYSMT